MLLLIFYCEKYTKIWELKKYKAYIFCLYILYIRKDEYLLERANGQSLIWKLLIYWSTIVIVYKIYQII